MNIAVSRELAQALHDYLLTRPMAEVEHLVVGLRQAQFVNDNHRGDPQPEPDEPGD